MASDMDGEMRVSAIAHPENLQVFYAVFAERGTAVAARQNPAPECESFSPFQTKVCFPPLALVENVL